MADTDTVPVAFRSRVCGCGKRDAFTNPATWPDTSFYDDHRSRYDLPFNWWVCTVCLKPAPLNALNARLIRECEMCEDFYFITHYPDRMDMCPLCA